MFVCITCHIIVMCDQPPLVIHQLCVAILSGLTKYDNRNALKNLKAVTFQ